MMTEAYDCMLRQKPLARAVTTAEMLDRQRVTILV
jgi:hypothetical protein